MSEHQTMRGFGNVLRAAAFVPSGALFLVATQLPNHPFAHSSGPLSARDEVLAFAFIAAFVALLFAMSKWIRPRPQHQASRNRPPAFEVVALDPSRNV